MPFCRLDLTEDPIAEAERCLDAGARGIKLHPRAQAFDFGEAALNPVFQIAAERRVPILIHAGRGLPAIADDLRNLVEHHTEAQLILAHGAIADLEHIARTLNTPQCSLRHLRLELDRPAHAARLGIAGADRVCERPALRDARDIPARALSWCSAGRAQPRRRRGRCSGATPSGPRAASRAGAEPAALHPRARAPLQRLRSTTTW